MAHDGPAEDYAARRSVQNLPRTVPPKTHSTPMLKKILISLLALIVVLVIIVAVQPS